MDGCNQKNDMAESRGLTKNQKKKNDFTRKIFIFATKLIDTTTFLAKKSSLRVEDVTLFPNSSHGLANCIVSLKF